MILYAGIPIVADLIFPKATFAAGNLCKTCHSFDPHDVFGLLVAQLPLDPQAKGGTVADGQGLVVHAVSQDRLRVESVHQVDAFVIGLTAEIVGAVHDQTYAAGEYSAIRARLGSVPVKDAINRSLCAQDFNSPVVKVANGGTITAGPTHVQFARTVD